MDKVRLNEKLIKSLSSVLFTSVAELIPKAGLTNTTWYSIVAKPMSATVQQLVSMANGLHIPVRKFFSFSNDDFIGKREDYVIEPYTPCYYDAAQMQHVVSSRSDATWQKASEVAGVTPVRLRNSLLGETRTPLVRFLSVCEAFDIDPFTILIDPNPEKNKSRRASRTTANNKSGLHADIAALRQQMSDLTDAVADLKEKYNELLTDHKALALRVDVDIEKSSRDYLSIAAERVED